MNRAIRLLSLLFILLLPVQSWAAISSAGTYTNVNAAAILGANSVTDVTVPAHSIALVWFHFYDADVNRFINNSGSLPVLSGATCTHIATQVDASNNATQAFWCTGAVTGAAKTLSYTVAVNDITVGLGISILFLSGTDTTAPIRASAVDADNGGASTSGAMTFSAGDWTLMGYSADSTASPTNGGANTAAIAEYALTDGAPTLAGVYYKTDTGTISLGGGTFTSLVAMTVKPSGGGGSPPTSQFRLRVQP